MKHTSEKKLTIEDLNIHGINIIVEGGPKTGKSQIIKIIEKALKAHGIERACEERVLSSK